jgi:hypothetical protein
MRIRTYSTIDAQQTLPLLQWDLALHGEPVDVRGEAALAAVQVAAKELVLCDYDIKGSRNLRLSGAKTIKRDVAVLFKPGKQVLLEATTLGFVELLHLLRAAHSQRIEAVDLLYVEPQEYQRDVTLDAPWTREFSLSSSRRFEGVPGFVTDLSLFENRAGRLVAFLGYEGARLVQAYEQLGGLADWQKYAIFGIPGYAPGWEINALANNIASLDKNKFDSVQYCPASAVSSAYCLLDTIFGEAGGDAPMIVAPLGTKPHGIATALFLIEHSSYQETSLVYDHPERSRNRSRRVRRWHLYRVKFDHI